VLGPTLLVAVGIGLTFPTLMATATADAAEDDAGLVGGLASTAAQVGASVGLAVLATVAAAEGGAAGYRLVFLVAAGLGPAIAAIGLLLPRHRRT
jgi:MFS family permease